MDYADSWLVRLRPIEPPHNFDFPFLASAKYNLKAAAAHDVTRNN
jgi:hypothetical protein